MTSRKLLAEFLHRYHSIYPEEVAFKDRFLDLLTHSRAFYRDHLPGHITASSWIIDETGEFTLLTHHAKLNRWLQPGGHADGDENVFAVAEREAREETGLTFLKVKGPDIFDLDIHPIPSRNDFPEHWHYDIRFLFEAKRKEAFTVTAESHALAWVPAADVGTKTGQNRSMLRMSEKVRSLFGADQQ
jgi:8-oxo-dGTP pyrophosphatase MutT (NUDIX family)